VLVYIICHIWSENVTLSAGYRYNNNYNNSQWRTQEFFSGGGSTNSVEDREQRERGSGGDSGGSCNLAQEISFHIVKSS
jgi:hypothetical protein